MKSEPVGFQDDVKSQLVLAFSSVLPGVSSVANVRRLGARIIEDRFYQSAAGTVSTNTCPANRTISVCALR